MSAYFFFADFLGAWLSALPAAFRPRGLVFSAASAFPAKLAARAPVLAIRPVCDRALPAADFAALVAFGLLSTFADAEAALVLVFRAGIGTSEYDMSAILHFALHIDPRAASGSEQTT